MTLYAFCSCEHSLHPSYRNFGSRVPQQISYQHPPLPDEAQTKDKEVVQSFTFSI